MKIKTYLHIMYFCNFSKKICILSLIKYAELCIKEECLSIHTFEKNDFILQAKLPLRKITSKRRDVDVDKLEVSRKKVIWCKIETNIPYKYIIRHTQIHLNIFHNP